MTIRKVTQKKSPTRGRRLQDDESTLESLGESGEAMFSEAEAAMALGASADCLADLLRRSQPARKAYHGSRLKTVASLRRAQFKHAQSNAGMAMFLGRTHLGQVEQREGDDGEAFDPIGAGRRVRDKIAAVLAASSTPGDRESD